MKKYNNYLEILFTHRGRRCADDIYVHIESL